MTTTIPTRRIGFTFAVLAIFGLAILGQAVHVQLVQGARWRARAERQQSSESLVPAPRGEILDGSHRVLAQSREMVRLEIAPREVDDPGKLRRALASLGVNAALIARATDSTQHYMVLPGRYLALDAAPAIALRGVHSFASVQRAYAASPGAQALIGHVDAGNHALDGLELSLDSILRGRPGSTTVFHDANGRARESPIAPGVPPVPGDTVVLTINADLQEIAERALADAVARMGAEGGDIVILDPRTGDILAMASRRLDPRQTSTTVLTEPFEPGSTAKPFTAAALLSRGLVHEGDSVDTGDGVLRLAGRTQPIHDDHKIGRAPLQDVLRWSSNIGIIKFASRLTHQQEYDTFRDFGFGMATGVPFPAESPGILHPPSRWSETSWASMAMGYEIAVTPLQLAAGYAVFANGGKLMEPALVKEVIAPDGTVIYRRQPRVVRQVVSTAVADTVRHMLLDVVDEGTALQAAIQNYLLAGKTGTPRSTVRGHYVAGRYNPNFVGIFPGDDPQYVIVVKLTAPQSSIYAAQTAAPVTKAILEAALAARDAALDRGKLASSVVAARAESTRATADGGGRRALAESTAAEQAGAPSDAGGSVPFVVTLPLQRQPAAPRTLQPVPNVRGLPLRDAVRSLHKAGFHVQLARADRADAGTTLPAAGAVEPSGTLVRLLYDF